MATAPLLARRAVRLALLGLLVLQVAAGLWKTVRESRQIAATMWHRRDETLEEARRRALGADYVRGLELAEAAIPPDGTYLLVDEDRTVYVIELQGDLAPRRALMLDGGVRLGRRREKGRLVRGLPERAVVFHGADRAPEVVRTRSLLGRSGIR